MKPVTADSMQPQSATPGPEGQRRITVTARAFRSPEGEARYAGAYEATLRLWPVAYERFDVPTRFGPTHVVAAGPADAPPLILLHAFGFGASSWYANVGEWSQHYRVYAVDTIGDMTNSVMEQTITARAQFAQWLGDVMDALGVPSASFVGHSYGGWLTLNMAMEAPERVQRIVLLAPAASFVKLYPQFTMRTMLMALLRNRWSTRSFARWCLAEGHEIPDSLLDQFYHGLRHFRWRPVILPNRYTDMELQRIQAPALMLFGEQEVIEDWRGAIERAKRFLPGIQVETLAEASHALIMEQPERLNQRVLAFLQP